MAARGAGTGNGGGDSSSDSDGGQGGWSSDSEEEDVIGLQEAESIYATSPGNPLNRRRKRWARTLALLILAASLEKCVLLTSISAESLGAFSITGARYSATRRPAARIID